MVTHTTQNCNTHHRFLTPDDFSAIADSFCDRLPKKPYCTDELGYLIIRPKATAIKERYLQLNPPCYTSFLIFDIDRQGASLAWYDENLPPPTFTTQNPENGHAHLAYALKTAVCTTDHARQKPIEYLAKIQAGITRKLGADVGYSGLITKNPLHSDWRTHVWRTEAYELGELADYVELVPLSKKERELGLGRNCALFDTVRIWAYTAVRDYRHARDGVWYETVLNYADNANTAFLEPLGFSEVRAIAKSIASYCLRNDVHCYNRFVERQKEKGSKGGVARSNSYADKRLTAMEMHLRGFNNSEIARRLGVSRPTIIAWLKV